jgi:hypothetical protein
VAAVNFHVNYPGENKTRPDGPAFHIDRSGLPIYQTRFAWTDDFSEGLAAVKGIDGQRFHIDKQGHAVHKKRYEKLDGFRGGVSVGLRNGQWYLIKRETLFRDDQCPKD